MQSATDPILSPNSIDASLYRHRSYSSDSSCQLITFINLNELVALSVLFDLLGSPVLEPYKRRDLSMVLLLRSRIRDQIRGDSR